MTRHFSKQNEIYKPHMMEHDEYLHIPLTSTIRYFFNVMIMTCILFAIVTCIQHNFAQRCIQIFRRLTDCISHIYCMTIFQYEATLLNYYQNDWYDKIELFIITEKL